MDSDVSEEESLKKEIPRVRFATAEIGIPKKTLSQRINEMNKEERKKFNEEIAKSYCRKARAARAAREGDSASLKCTAWSRLRYPDSGKMWD